MRHLIVHHLVSEKCAYHVRSDTNHAPSEQDFGNVLYNKKSDLERDLVSDFDHKFSDQDFDHLAFDNYLIVRVWTNINTRLQYITISSVRWKKKYLILVARFFRQRAWLVLGYDTVRAPRHNHMRSASKCHWL